MDDVSASAVPAEPEREPRRWLRAAGLLGLVMMTVVFAPSVLIGVPFVLLVMFLPGPGPAAWLVAGLVVIMVMMPGQEGSIWWIERAWAVLAGGVFTAATLRWPSSRFTNRGLAAVGAATVLVLLYFVASPATGETVDWLVRTKVGGDLATFIEGLRTVADVEPEFIATFDRFFSAQIRLYPSLVALSTFAALGVSWWLYVRLMLGRADGLGSLRNFAFPDALVWLVIGGLSLVLVGTAWAKLVGYNTLLFMGVLYALRGLAVVAFFKGGVTLAGGVLAAVMTLLAAPVVIGAAVMVGLGDTWLGLRARAEGVLGDG